MRSLRATWGLGKGSEEDLKVLKGGKGDGFIVWCVYLDLNQTTIVRLVSSRGTARR